MPRTQPNSPSPPPPLANFPFATGGFDFPQASASPPPPPPPAARSRTSPRSRVNQLTEFLNQHYYQVASEGDDEPSQRRPQAARADVGARRRTTARNGRLPYHAERETDSANGRPNATPSERYLRRSVIHDPPTDALDSLSDLLPNPFRPTRSPPSITDGQQRQTKRRKLDHPAKPVSEYDGFKYGYRGQVARGRLRMQVVSCDGGEYDRDSSLYRVQNVLSNDKSVYCSQSGRCNLLLKHIGETPFCLEKVIIRAPDRGFTAPVQEGLIFVAMSPEKLLSGTSAYEIEYSKDSSSPPPLRHSPSISPAPSPPRNGEEDQLSFEEAIRDEAIWERSRQALAERVESMRLRTRNNPAIQAVRDRHQQTADEDDALNECPYYIEEGDPNAAGISAPTPPPFTTTTESEPEDTEGSETMPSAAIMADRLRRESRYRSENEDDDDREDLIQHPLATLRRAEPLGSPRLRTYQERAQRWRTLQNNMNNIDPIRATRLRTPSRIELKHSLVEPEETIKPHARFFIARHKNKITIKFHPAISGKHVLLKLWSPTSDGNIDMESVQFYGYSGPRFFPAVQPR